MRSVFLILACMAMGASAVAAPISHAPALTLPNGQLVQKLAQSWSCSPRRTCSQISSCAEARWYRSNCSWGGRLDGDSDGIPCENIC